MALFSLAAAVSAPNVHLNDLSFENSYPSNNAGHIGHVPCVGVEKRACVAPQ